jgi:biopolymer transport protein ExbB
MTKLRRTARVAAVAFAIVLQGAQVQAQQPPVGAGSGQRPIPAQTQPPPLATAPGSAGLRQPAGTAAPTSQPVIPLAGASSAGSAEIEAPAAGATRPTNGIGPLRELSPWSMFQSADVLVKAVMIGLAFASLVTWTIFFAKTVHLSRARKDVGSALARVSGIRSLSEAQLALGSAPNVLSELLAAAVQEIQLSDAAAEDAGIKERAASRFSEIVRMEVRAVRSGMAIVATIGATAPFVGLFGTVWGIMNSFIGISKAQTTNLAVVAPGIAEALLATALGLATAIPAVIIYNHFSRATKSYLDLVGRGSGAIGRLLSRDLDRFRDRVASRAAE